MTTDTFQNLLSQQGDATSLVPITAPAPQPQPTPSTDFPYAPLDAWVATRKTWWTKAEKAAADAYTTWRGAHK